MKLNKKILVLCLTFIIAFSTVGCGASKSAMDAAAPESFKNSVSSMGVVNGFYSDNASINNNREYATEDYDSIESGVSSENQTNDLNKDILFVEEKLVYRCNFDLQSINYDETVKFILEEITKNNGIVQSQNEYDDDYDWYYKGSVNNRGTKRICITARIPTENYHNFIGIIGESDIKVMQKSQTIDNISQRYYDTKTEIESLKIQETRLLGMMKSATKVEDMISIEARLTEVQMQLSKLQTNLVYMDMDVAYSYVTINLQEVIEYIDDEPVYKKNTFVDRLYETCSEAVLDFLDFLEEVLFFVIYALPYAVLFGLVLFILKKTGKLKSFKIFKKKNKRNKEQYKEVKDKENNL